MKGRKVGTALSWAPGDGTQADVEGRLRNQTDPNSQPDSFTSYMAWISCSISLCLSFLIFKISILNQYLAPRVVGGRGVLNELYKVQQWQE